jgi:predicted small metal-binding protein
MITGSSKEEIMNYVIDHGKRDHNLKESNFSPDLMNKIMNLITESKQ